LPNLPKSTRWPWDQDALAELFAHYRERLKRMVLLRLDHRLQGKIDASDVLQEAYLDLARRANEIGNNPAMPFFLWLRLLTGQRLLAIHRRHFGTRMRDVGQFVVLDHDGDALAQKAPGVLGIRRRVPAQVPTGFGGADGAVLLQQPRMDPGQHGQMVAIELAIGWVPGIGLQGGPMVRSALQEQPSLLVLRRLSVAAALRQTPGSRPEAAPRGRAERPSCAAALSYAIYPIALIAQLVAGQNEAPAMFLLSRWRVSRVSRFTSLAAVASKRPTPTDGLQAVRCQRR
jgi:hypothetical protein